MAKWLARNATPPKAVTRNLPNDEAGENRAERLCGFPGPEVFTFDLTGGKNLLLYGENGSGKSSLYVAPAQGELIFPPQSDLF